MRAKEELLHLRAAKEELLRLRAASAERRRRFEARARAKGVVRVTVFIPQADAEEFKRMAREWVSAYLAGGADD